MSDILTVIATIVTGGLAMYFFGYRKAGKVHEAKQTKKRLKDIKAAQEVRDEVEILDDAGLADRAARWMRGNND